MSKFQKERRWLHESEKFLCHFCSSYISLLSRKLTLKAGVNISMYLFFLVFCSAGPFGGIHAALFPPSLWRAEGNQRNQSPLWDRKRRHRNGQKREREYCSEQERRANNQGFWSRRTRGNAQDQLRSVTEPLCAKRGSLRRCCCWCCLFCAVLSLNELGHWNLRGTKSKFTGIHESQKDGVLR